MYNLQLFRLRRHGAVIIIIFRVQMKFNNSH